MFPEKSQSQSGGQLQYCTSESLGDLPLQVQPWLLSAKKAGSGNQFLVFIDTASNRTPNLPV